HQRRRVRVDDARIYQARFNWKDIARIKRNFDIPLMLKGIATAEDAKIAVDHGVDCVYVSNHGGRQLDQGLGSVAVLPEIVEAVAGRARIIVDGSITRGTDVVKAIILGADAVAVGRLYVYGLAAAGKDGVVRLFEILEDEIRICLSLLGVTSYEELDRSYLRGVAGRACPCAQPVPAARFAERDLLARPRNRMPGLVPGAPTLTLSSKAGVAGAGQAFIASW